MSRIDMAGMPFTVQGLEYVLRQLNKTGSVEVVNVRPGSVSMLELGAVLAHRAAERDQ